MGKISSRFNLTEGRMKLVKGDTTKLHIPVQTYRRWSRIIYPRIFLNKRFICYYPLAYIIQEIDINIASIILALAWFSAIFGNAVAI